MRFWYQVAAVTIRILMKIFANLEVIGRENLNDWEPSIVASNHISYLDPPLVGSVMGRELCFLAKKELFRNRIFGGLISYYNAIPVKRGVIDREALNNVIELLNKGNSLLMFPEGSRKSFTARPGIGLIVYQTKVSVLPVKVENTDKLLQCLLRKKRIRVIIGKRIDVSEYLSLPEDKGSYRKIAENVLNVINDLHGEDVKNG